GGIVYQAPLAGGEFAELAKMPGPLRVLVGWGDHLVFAAAGLESGAGIIDLTTSPAAVTVARAPFRSTEAYGIYSPEHRTVYWLARLLGESQLILLDVDTWAQAFLPMPSFVGPYNGIA